MMTGGAESLELVDSEHGEGGGEVRSAVEWAQVRRLAAVGVSLIRSLPWSDAPTAHFT
jgi:hypothetical protein